MIDKVMINIGAFFLIFGGLLLFAVTLVFAAYLVACLWIATSNKWRNICKAESLIFEYRKNRKKYLDWKREQEEKHEND